MQRKFQIEALADDGDDDIDRDGDPRLGFIADAILSHARRYSRCVEIVMSGVKQARGGYCVFRPRKRISRPFETNGTGLIQGAGWVQELARRLMAPGATTFASR